MRHFQRLAKHRQSVARHSASCHSLITVLFPVNRPPRTSRMATVEIVCQYHIHYRIKSANGGVWTFRYKMTTEGFQPRKSRFNQHIL